MKLRRWKRRWRYRVKRYRTRARALLLRARYWLEPIWFAVALAIISVGGLYLLRGFYAGWGNLGQGVYVEATGAIMDIVVFGVIIAFFTFIRDQRQRTERYREEIDDYKKWDSEEARLRIAGNIRRLNRLGKTDIDFSGIVLQDFSFNGQDIWSIEGSVFSLGLRLDKFSKNATNLTNVDFSGINCQEVTFSRSFGKIAVLGLVGKNLSFGGANLTNAIFEGANLSWDDYVAEEEDWYSDAGKGEDGYPLPPIQEHFPSFWQADLKGCSFKNAKLDHADFRGADNILEANFEGVKGLDTCFFDVGVCGKIEKNMSISSNSMD